MPRLAGARNRIESPDFFSGVYVPRGNETPHAELTAGSACDDFVFHDKRSVSKRVALLWIGRRSIPDLLARPGIDREHVSIERCHKQAVAENCEASRQSAAAVSAGRIGLVVKGPDGFAGARIQGN